MKFSFSHRPNNQAILRKYNPRESIFMAILQSYRILNLIFFFNGFLVAIFASRVAPIKEQLGITHDILGNLLLASPIGAILCMSCASFLSARYGSRKIIMLTAITALIPIILFLIVPSFYGILLGMFMFGSTVGLMDVVMNSQAVQLEIRMKRTIMNGLHGLWSCGTLLGSGFIMLMIHLQINLTVSTIITCIIIICIIVYGHQFLLDDRSAKDNSSGFSMPLSLPPLAVLPLGLLLLLVVLPESIALEWSGLWFVEHLHAETYWQAGGVFVISSSMMIGRLLGNRLTDIFGGKKIIRFGVLIAFIGIFTVITFETTAYSVIGLLILGLGLSNAAPIVYKASGNIKGTTPAQGLAGLTTIGYGAFMFAPWMMGMISANFGLKQAFLIVMILPLAAFIYSFFIQLYES